jgi:hypothetical protein
MEGRGVEQGLVGDGDSGTAADSARRGGLLPDSIFDLPERVARDAQL